MKLAALRAGLDGLEAVLAHAYDPAVSMMALALTQDSKILLCGNGGSACQAMHMAAELVVRFVADRKAYAAIALSDSAVITAASNDYGYERGLSRQVEALGRAGDVLVAFSTSGKSRNVLEAIAAAKRIGMPTLGLSGSTLLGCDVDIGVPSTNTARVQELHLVCVHLLVEGIEERLPK